MLKHLGTKLVLTTALAGIAGVFLLSQSPQSNAQDAAFSAAQKDAMGGIIKDYLMENPQVIFDAIEAHRENEEIRQQEQAANAIKDNIAKLTAADAPAYGASAADADVTIVEFFDYNCGYCKRVLPDIAAITKDDKKVRFVFKEMPILGPTSLSAAKWALAAKEQGKYFEYHSALMEHRGPKEEKNLEKLAEGLGLDVEKMKADANSDAIQALIDADVALARTIGINGTPAFIVGETLYPGYIGEDGMKDAVKEARAAQ